MCPDLRTWSPEEEEIIKVYYKNTPIEKISIMLPKKSKQAIKNKAARLGINKDLSISYSNRKHGNIIPKEQLDDLLQIFPSVQTPYQAFEQIQKKYSDIKYERVKNQWKKFYKQRICIDQNLSAIQKRQETIRAMYGVDNASKNPLIQQQKIDTSIKKYQVIHPSKSQIIQQKIKNTRQKNLKNIKQSFKKALETGIRNGNIFTLASGQAVSEYCREKGVNYSNAFSIFKKHGEVTFLDYCQNYSHNISSVEICFKNLLKDTFPNISKYDKKPDESKDLNYRPDFQLQNKDIKIYINVDGLYTHSEKSLHTQIGSNINYHFNMREQFLAKNLRIYQFRADEIFNKPSIVRSIVLGGLGIFEQKINARECIIQKINKPQSDEFLENNHLMGKSSATGYGLFYKNELVSLISIKRSSKNNNDIEIARFCSRTNTSVRGGFSKLLKYVENIYNPENIISFCDLRYGNGNVYNKSGFECKSISLGWQWTDFTTTYNRLQCRANMDDRKLSQEEYAKELGWVKIYDAGQSKYVKHLYGDSIQKEEYTPEPNNIVEIIWSEQEEKLIQQKIIELKELTLSVLAWKLKQYFPNKNPKMIKAKILQICKQYPTLFIYNFNYFTTLEALPSGAKIRCKCICGNERLVFKQLLKDSRVKSCGCKKIELCRINGGRKSST